MTVLMNFIQSAVFFCCFLGIALGGIAAGRWFRNKKDTKESR